MHIIINLHNYICVCINTTYSNLFDCVFLLFSDIQTHSFALLRYHEPNMQ